jgi:DsbC/DsbD-like thiol-disulfide interchange protein
MLPLRPLALLATLLAFAPPALAGEASPWDKGHHSRARLLAGGSIEGGARRLSGIEIRLDPGYKTYWRTPGEAGLPPTLDWSGSRNVRAVEVVWPAPQRLDDPGGASFGYQDGVVLPLKVTPQVPGKPVELGLALHYGVCKDICIPAQANLRLPLIAEGSGTASLLRAALDRAPRRQGLNEGALSVVSATAAGGRVRVLVRSPSGTPPQLFAEAPEGWYLGAPGASAPATDRGATAAFDVEILERPRDASGPVPLTFTLVGGSDAVETVVSLDAGVLSR